MIVRIGDKVYSTTDVPIALFISRKALLDILQQSSGNKDVGIVTAFGPAGTPAADARQFLQSSKTLIERRLVIEAADNQTPESKQ